MINFAKYFMVTYEEKIDILQLLGEVSLHIKPSLDLCFQIFYMITT